MHLPYLPSAILIGVGLCPAAAAAQAQVRVIDDTLAFQDREHFDLVVGGLHEDSRARLDAFEASLDFASLREIVEPLEAEVGRLELLEGIEPGFPFDIDDPVLLAILNPAAEIRIGDSYFRVGPDWTIEVTDGDEGTIEEVRCGRRPSGGNIVYHPREETDADEAGNGPPTAAGGYGWLAPWCRRKMQVHEYSSDLQSTVWGRVKTLNLPFYQAVIASTERYSSFQLLTDVLHVQGSFQLTSRFCEDVQMIDFSETGTNTYKVKHTQFLGSSPTKRYKLATDCFASMHYAHEIGDAVGFAFLGHDSWGAVPHFDVAKTIPYGVDPVLQNVGVTSGENWYHLQVMKVDGYGEPYTSDWYWSSGFFPGPAPNTLNLEDHVPSWFDFDPGSYRVVLGVGNTCTTWSEKFDWFTVQ